MALLLQEIGRLVEETSKLFNQFLEKIGETDPSNFRGNWMEDIAAVEDSVQADIFWYNIDIVDRSMIGKLPRRIVAEHSNNVRLLRYNSQICYVSKFNALLKPIVVHRVITSSNRFSTWSGIWLLAKKKELNMFFQRLCINCEKHCLTN